MSRGFVKEDDLELVGTDLPERPLSPHTNYVTPNGLQQLQLRLNRLENERLEYVSQKDDPNAQQKLAEIDRDLRYFSARFESAQCVEPKLQPKDVVLFGAKVEVEDENGAVHQFHIVGEDEADISAQKVSYVSPIAKALIGKKVSDQVIWQRPAGKLALEIIEIHY